MELNIQKLRQEAYCYDTDGITDFYAGGPEGQEDEWNGVEVPTYLPLNPAGGIVTIPVK
jgi:hypothetical protein